MGTAPAPRGDAEISYDFLGWLSVALFQAVMFGNNLRLNGTAPGLGVSPRAPIRPTVRSVPDTSISGVLGRGTAPSSAAGGGESPSWRAEWEIPAGSQGSALHFPERRAGARRRYFGS